MKHKENRDMSTVKHRYKRKTADLLLNVDKLVVHSTTSAVGTHCDGVIEASQAKSNKVPCVKHPQMESASKPHSYRRKCPDLLLRVQNPHSESLLDKDYNVATTDLSISVLREIVLIGAAISCFCFCIIIPSLETVDEICKVASASLSPGVAGQIFVGLMVSSPKPGDISYLKFTTESKAILDSLTRRARIMTDGFNSCKSVVCNFTEGAMYSFPQIRRPSKAIEAAQRDGKVPDVFYCLKLLEATGILTFPGSGFGQKEGVFSLGTTILPAEEEKPDIMASFKKFNEEFMELYEDNRGYSRM